MDKNLLTISTVGMSKEEWLSRRTNGIGGSEVGIVTGLSPYKSSLQLFHEKINGVSEIEENEAMHWGKALEDLIAERWQYWDGTPESMIANFNAQNVIRKCRRVNAYIVNPKYPYLFSSLDRVINKNGQEKEGVLEIKTISGFASKMWETGIPPSYVMQLQTYLLVTGLDYGEIALLRDGRYMEVVPFAKSEIICERIIEACSHFWSKVEKAKEILRQAGVKTYDELSMLSNRMEVRAEIDSIEPEPDGSEAYEAFISTRYKEEALTIQGTEEYFIDSARYMIYNAAIKELTERQRYHSNRLMNHMKEAEVLDFGSRGKVSWKTNKKGSRVLSVRVKDYERLITDEQRTIRAIEDAHDIELKEENV